MSELPQKNPDSIVVKEKMENNMSFQDVLICMICERTGMFDMFDCLNCHIFACQDVFFNLSILRIFCMTGGDATSSKKC